MSALAPATRRAPRSAPRALPWAALLACAALLPLHPARADLDATCDRVAETFLEDLAATDSAVSTAGCDAASSSVYGICGSRGNAGPCSSVPACADAADTIVSDACTSDTIGQACCTEYITRFDTGGMWTMACLQSCSSSSTPGSSAPATPTDRGTPPLTPGSTINPVVTDATCADFAVNALEALAVEYDDYASTSCAAADTGDICDIVAVAGACSSNPSCAGVEVGLSDDCTSAADDSGCCNAFFVKPCSTCDPVPGLCYQVCVPSQAPSGGSPVVATGGPPSSSGSALSDELVYVGGNGGVSGNGGDERSSGGDGPTAAPERASLAVPLLGRIVWAVSGAAAVALGALL